MAEDWKKYYEKAVDLYEAGKYRETLPEATSAIEILSEDLSNALRKRGWAARHMGYKNPTERDEMYKIAEDDAELILRISKDVATRNSAIKLLILLPDQDVKKWCSMGIRELKGSRLNEQEQRDLAGELKNSLGIEIGKQYPRDAISIFLEAYEEVTKKTILAGHLLHNTGSNLLKMAKEENDLIDRQLCLKKALSYLERALEEYPSGQTGHRSAVEGKIKDAEKQIKDINDQIERENREYY